VEVAMAAEVMEVVVKGEVATAGAKEVEKVEATVVATVVVMAVARVVAKEVARVGGKGARACTCR
jgi:hypothetical protein